MITQFGRQFPPDVEWSRAVIARDGCCVVCGAAPTKKSDRKWAQPRTIAHRLLPATDFPDRRHDLKNSATLCRSCHFKIHLKLVFHPATKPAYLAAARRGFGPRLVKFLQDFVK